jgi:hypothetical protein
MMYDLICLLRAPFLGFVDVRSTVRVRAQLRKEFWPVGVRGLVDGGEMTRALLWLNLKM